ncbi:Arabinose operon regulatory protein [termite gut metagenome]|uniref:Arabinose operon regulatory protein n=1 Tax=termite gut metagenome TaxID=433724 RepID=A0A5J4S4S8_9ZZZZ
MEGLGVINCIGNDYVFGQTKMSEGFDISLFKHPYKLNSTVSSLIIKGCVKGKINLNEYQMSAPCLITIHPDEILQLQECSDDYSAMHIVYSKEFINALSAYIKERLPFYLDIYNSPVFNLSDEELNSYMEYFIKAKEIVSNADNPFRLQTIIHLTMFFFYSKTYQFRKARGETAKTIQNPLVNNFLKLVRENYKIYHSLDFYADKLCISSKYLTTLVKRKTGTTATDWIEKHIILEAQALLKSTNMTIQQISDELNFSSQTFFGKFFKRIVGMSPKDYRKSN